MFCRDDEERVEEQEGDGVGVGAAPIKKQAPWSKMRKGKGGKGGKKPGSNQKRKPNPPKNAAASGNTDTQEQSKLNSEADSDADGSDLDEKDSVSGSEDENDKQTKNISSLTVDDDDEEWEKLQAKLNKREKFEGKSRISHTVHCPFFPEEKQEYWWTYICDRKSRTLLTAPYYVTNLVEREEIQLKFTAPRWPGVYTFTVCLRSGNHKRNSISIP